MRALSLAIVFLSLFVSIVARAGCSQPVKHRILATWLGEGAPELPMVDEKGRLRPLSKNGRESALYVQSATDSDHYKNLKTVMGVLRSRAFDRHYVALGSTTIFDAKNFVDGHPEKMPLPESGNGISTTRFDASPKGLKNIGAQISQDLAQWKSQKGETEVVLVVLNHGTEFIGPAGNGFGIAGDPALPGLSSLSAADIKAFASALPADVKLKIIMSQCFSANSLDVLLNVPRECACGVSSSGVDEPAHSPSVIPSKGNELSRHAPFASNIWPTLARSESPASLAQGVWAQLGVESQVSNPTLLSSERLVFEHFGLANSNWEKAELGAASSLKKAPRARTLSDADSAMLKRSDEQRENLLFELAPRSHGSREQRLVAATSWARKLKPTMKAYLSAYNASQPAAWSMNGVPINISMNAVPPRIEQLTASKMLARRDLEEAFLREAPADQVRRFFDLRACELEFVGNSIHDEKEIPAAEGAVHSDE